MDNKEKEYLGKLEVGYGIVKLQGRWFSPFLVRFPLININKGIVTDEMIRRKMRRYSGYSEGWYGADKESSQIQDISPRDKVIKQQERHFLVDVLKSPLSGVVKRNERLGISSRKGNMLKEVLVSKGLIEPKEIPTNTGRTVLVRLTRNGCRILEKQDTRRRMELDDMV